jgi:methyl-accepting chemotaxis protein
LAATTGDERWENRYFTFVPQLDTALAEAQELVPNVFESKGFNEVDAANDKLIAMEEQAFSLIQQGNQENAEALLLSPEYEQQKEIYATGIDKVTAALKQYISETVVNKEQQIFSVLIAIGAITAILLVAWITVLRMMQRYIKIMNDTGLAIATPLSEIATTVQQQECSTNQQAVAVNQTTKTMEQLGASTHQSASQAESSTSGAREALSLAERGDRDMAETLEGIGALKEQVASIATQIGRLSEQTAQISLVSELVASLANQTNMLALNAAVEAVRAGEQGKGFSVVAGEIRKLADRSKQSAAQIDTLVQDIQSSLRSTVMVTDEGNKKALRGIELTQITTETFSNLTKAVKGVFFNSQQISMNAKQQAVAIQEVLDVMNNLNLEAKETALGINQIKVSIEQLDEAACKMKKLV